MYMLISSASVIFGPTLGGLIISAYGWRAMLWTCVAICAVTFIVCVLTAGKQDSQRRPLKNFDGIGAVLVLIFFSLMLCVPSFGQNFGWTSPAFLGVLIAAVISLFGLTAAERKAVHPARQFYEAECIYPQCSCPVFDTGTDAGQYDQHHRLCQLHPAE